MTTTLTMAPYAFTVDRKQMERPSYGPERRFVTLPPTVTISCTDGRTVTLDCLDSETFLSEAQGLAAGKVDEDEMVAWGERWLAGVPLPTTILT